MLAGSLYSALLMAGLAGCAGSGGGVVTEPAPQQSASLIGLDADELLRRFGAPELLRRERRAEYWRYRHQSCFVDVYLYADPPSPQPRTIHVGVRRQAGGDVSASLDCEASLADFATGPPPALPGVEAH